MRSYNAVVNTPTRTHRLKVSVPLEVKEQLRNLSSSAPHGVRVSAIIDAGDGLERLRSALESAQTPITPPIAMKICKAIKRSVKRKPRKLQCAIEYDDRTIRATSLLFVLLVRASLKSTSQSEVQSLSPAKRNRQKDLVSLVALSLDTLVMLCQTAGNGSSWKHCVEYISAAADLMGTPGQDLLQRDSFSTSLLTVQQGLLSDLRRELRDGHEIEAASIFGSVRSYPSLRKTLADALVTMLQSESAKLPLGSQGWIMTTLGIESEPRQISYANPADAPEIRQAAGLLLLLWDNSGESSTTREAFERFRTLCEKHFHLYLKGHSGELADYDSRLHEVTGAEAERVRLTRPWVEFVDPPHSAIVVRALATAV
jgi:hypothetical protein